MSASVEIQPWEIRVGDLIRCEAHAGTTIGDSLTASEWRADGTEEAKAMGGTSTYYLLDRPKPAVVLPTTQTLGWIETIYDTRILQFWSDVNRCAETSNGARWNLEKEVTAFTPATAIPTEALDLLRYRLKTGAVAQSGTRAVKDFLAAVDNASTR